MPITCRAVNAIPENWPKEAIKGFSVSFIMQMVLTHNPSLSLAAGSLSVVATLVHTITEPLFRQVFQRTTVGELVRGSLTLIGTACIASACGYPQMITVPLWNIIMHALHIHFDPSIVNAHRVTWFSIML